MFDLRTAREGDLPVGITDRSNCPHYDTVRESSHREKLSRDSECQLRPIKHCLNAFSQPSDSISSDSRNGSDHVSKSQGSTEESEESAGGRSRFTGTQRRL